MWSVFMWEYRAPEDVQEIGDRSSDNGAAHCNDACVQDPEGDIVYKMMPVLCPAEAYSIESADGSTYFNK
jgi:hypothetical protein